MMKLNRELFERVSKLTGTEYEVDYPKESQDEQGETYVRVYDTYQIERMLQDLIIEIDRLEERIEDLENDIENNYEPISIAKQVRIADSDFI